MSQYRSDYLYDLPEELIAQTPAGQRDTSRLLVMNRETGELRHRHFGDIREHLRPGDALVINDTRVIPARLIGRRPTGGKVELLLLEPLSHTSWQVLAKPARRCPVGEEILFPGDWRAVVTGEGEAGRRVVDFEPAQPSSDAGDFRTWLHEVGQVPLPPYINRAPEREDLERYQTVYAAHDGAVAAPTAGLHFTDELLLQLEESGVQTVRITLHVGIGTFRPVSVEDVSDHRMDYERYTVSEAAAKTMNSARERGGRIVAVGTTSVRTLETVTDERGEVHAGSGATDLFIRPPYRFKAVDALLTNFHLPGSTLLMRVSAFAGRENILAAYGEAVKKRYRFFSYGDAMFLE